jgi:neutral peptidase B
LILGSVGLCIALLALFKLKPAYSRSESPKGYSAENTPMGNSAATPNATPDNLVPRPSKQQKGNVNNSGSAAHQQASPYYLQSLEGNQKLNISSYTASKGEGFVIGRSLELVHLQLRDERISRRHLRIKSHSDYFTVEDLNSTHGTMLDGERLKAFLPAPIKHGQLLRIADFSYVFKVS